MSSLSDLEILYDLPEGEYASAGVGGIRTRTIRAGDSLEVECFPRVNVDHSARREARRRKSSPAQRALNLRNTRLRICRLLECNFGRGDIVLHPTYDYGFIDRGSCNLEDARRRLEESGIPMDVDVARKRIKNFVAKLRRLVRKRGGDPKALKYLYVVETTREPRDGDIHALPARYHYHMVVSSLGILTVEDVNACWGWGYTRAQALDMRFNGLKGLANYITKQFRRDPKRAARRWGHSLHMREPIVRVSDRKVSRRRAAMVARDVQYAGREIFERLYPGYGLEECEVKYSDFVPGAFIYARLRRRSKSCESRPSIRSCAPGSTGRGTTSGS